MICHKNKFIFVHVPKAAGSSVLRCLGLKPVQHQKASSEMRLNADYFSFGFVRNPWDRLVSAFFYLKKGGTSVGDKKKQIGLLKYNSFEDFVLNAKEEFSWLHFKNQSSWIDTRIDFIGRFENLQNDFDNVCGKINISKKELPVTNSSNHKNYTEYYSNKMKEIIAEEYKEDIIKFNYSFK
mgnify:CR=1 FL=1